jgi:hypothetical protein
MAIRAMLSRYLLIWVVFAGVFGFAVGGSFVASYQIPLSQNEAGPQRQQIATGEKVTEQGNKPLRSLCRPIRLACTL